MNKPCAYLPLGLNSEQNGVTIFEKDGQDVADKGSDSVRGFCGMFLSLMCESYLPSFS